MIEVLKSFRADFYRGDSMVERYMNQLAKLCLAESFVEVQDKQYVYTSHVLMGLMSEGRSLACRFLLSKSVTLQAVRDCACKTQMVCEPSIEKMVKDAFDLVEKTGFLSLISGHLLLSILGEKKNLAYLILEKLMPDLDEAILELESLIRNGHSD